MLPIRGQVLVELIRLLREFGWALNLALLTAVLGVVWGFYRAAIKAKDIQLDVLRQQLEIEKASSIENVVQRMRAFREFHSLWVLEQVKSWHDASVQQLERLRDRLTEESAPDVQARVREELNVRAELLKRFLGSPDSSIGQEPISFRALLGTWSLVGRNPGDDGPGYLGTLEIEENEGRLVHTWVTGSSSYPERGIGLLLGTSLAATYRDGVALYEILGTSIMRGRWVVVSRHGIGLEECRRISGAANPRMEAVRR